MNRRPTRYYRGAGLAVRAHVAMRWWTCPIGKVEGLLPREGRILDWGCGHGLLAVRLAQQEPGREVEGVDIDVDKLDAAGWAAEGAPFGSRLRFHAVDAGALPEGQWDAVVVNDVLYLMDPTAQEALVRSAAAAVAPGGTLVVKDMDTKPRWKLRASQLQELVSVRVLRITETAAGIHPSPGVPALVAWMEAEGLEVDVRPLHRGYHCPHVAVVGVRLSGGRLHP